MDKPKLSLVYDITKLEEFTLLQNIDLDFNLENHKISPLP